MMLRKGKDGKSEYVYNAYEHGPLYPNAVTKGSMEKRPVDNMRKKSGRPHSGRKRFCTTLFPDTRSDIMLYSQRMGMTTGAFIEFLFSYYITTENAIEETQILSKRRNKDMPPHLRSGIKVSDHGLYLM
jgi:hypothetical protein